MRSYDWFRAGRPSQLAITYTCLTAFLLFGYDQGVFGSLVTNPDFLDVIGNPSSGYLGIIVSCYNIGCFLGCALNFYIGPKWGRRDVILLAMMLISAGAVPQLMVGRIITGFGVGIDTSTIPMYQSELCKREYRGRLVTTEVVFVAIGIIIAYFFDYGLTFAGGPLAWRLPIACQIVIALSVSILVFGLPETPRYLIQKDRTDEAIAVMAKVWGLSPQEPRIAAEIEDIVKIRQLQHSQPFRWSKILHKDPLQTRWRLFLAVLLLFMNQWTGVNVIVFYAPTVLQTNVGLSRAAANVAGGCINIGNLLGAMIPATSLDRIGRRKPMLIGLFGQGIFMMLFAVMLSFQGTDKQAPTSKAAIAFLLLYMIFFGASLSSIPWCYATELLPLSVRAQGTAIAVFGNWAWVFIIVMVTPTMVQNLNWKCYFIFMAFSFAFIPMIYFWYPETKGLSLEEIDFLFLKESEVPLPTTLQEIQLSQKGTDAEIAHEHLEGIDQDQSKKTAV
ncbi:hypothetical protein CLAIMM_04640 [Cladophialophora immunda]|nr:hypothetical protein CLAIMM_04640 [Cladophialophora immunda]